MSANRESSEPLPTFSPGWMCVPRCLTRMLPARTCWPSARLTPSLLDSESRPFFVEPIPFYVQKLDVNLKHFIAFLSLDSDFRVGYTEIFRVLLLKAEEMQLKAGKQGRAQARIPLRYAEQHVALLRAQRNRHNMQDLSKRYSPSYTPPRKPPHRECPPPLSAKAGVAGHGKAEQRPLRIGKKFSANHSAQP